MHPELQGLLDRYDALLSAVEAGQMAAGDAIGTLAALKVVDGQGGQWFLTAEGQFMRSVPGGPALPADPHSFVPPSLMPPPASIPGVGPGLAGFPMPGSSPWDVSPPDQAMAGLPRPGDPVYQAMDDAQQGPPSRSLADRLLATKPWRNRTFLVVVACLLAGGLILVARSGSSGSGDAAAPPPAVVPNSVTQSPSPSMPAAAEPGTPAEAVAAALGGGDVMSLSGLSTAKAYPDLLMLAAQVRGARELGLVVEAVPDGSQVKVSFSDGSQVLARATVSLTRKGVVKGVASS